MSSTHYQVLEVQPSASRNVVAAAFRALLKEHAGDGDWIGRIYEAHHVLGDPDLRLEYDESLIRPPGKVIGGKYRIIKKIAEGGFGATFKAEHLELPGGLVCIKQAYDVSALNEATLQREATAMWDLRHYAIPAIRDYLRLPDGGVALVMSFIEGQNLHDLVEQKGPIEPEDVAWITERILNALSYMHRFGIVHGDIKPKNIIVQADNHMVSVVDFGLAAIKPQPGYERTGRTKVFSAPERSKNLPPLPETDLFSLGATMLFALSGDVEAVKSRKVPASVPDQLCEFIRRLMQKDPLDRPNWQSEDLQDTIAELRETVFGRRRSGMKPIRHISKPTTGGK